MIFSNWYIYVKETKLHASNSMQDFIANPVYLQENINFSPFLLKRVQCI